ncbi:MAG TPA: molybdopterin-dependent oxidoreductase [Casimicrobiaceae bacterium]|nr:molybdopterin-dependent oxidoreductase [Casimicrobiaceae bacterium]
MKSVRTTCPYCGVGCGVRVEVVDERIVSVRGDETHPANRGLLCSKGASLAATVGETGRALFPELRRERARQRGRVSWDAALDYAVDRFADAIGRRGSDAVAFYLSGQLLTEDYAVFNKLAKGLIGTNNVDTNSRLCMSSAVTGYKKTLGADAPPCSYEDIDHAKCLFIAGSNAAWTHPVLFRRINEAKVRDPTLRMIVVDPRRTVTADAADLHLAIRPGSDVALFNAMLHVIIWEDLIDTSFVSSRTNGFAESKAVVSEFTPKAAAEICGVTADAIVTAARWFAQSSPTLSLWCQGLNQSIAGTAKNAALINLHLATGQIGRAGAGPFSLTGQPNAMGGRETGGMATLLPGHREIGNATHREEVATIWGSPALSEKPGLTAVELFEAAADGAIDALWIACTNPAQSMPDLRLVRRALERTPFVVVQDAFVTSETVAYADLLLPASTWGEKEGTVTNSERRISHVRKAVAPPGEARADWEIAADFARRLQQKLARESPAFDYASVEGVFDEHRRLTEGRDLDIGGLSYALLDSEGPQQWPFQHGAREGRVRLYEDGRFPTTDGRANFVATPHVAVADRVDARFPLRLSTGRLRDQWHGMSRTERASSLAGHAPEPRLAMHPHDIAAAGLAEHEWALVESRRGAVAVPVEASSAQPRGHAYIPMHWGRNSLAGVTGEGGVNELTIRAHDPDSKQPELKHAAIRITRAAFAFEGVWWRTALDDALALRERARRAANGVGHAIVALYGGERPLVLLRVACDAWPDAARLKTIDAAFGVGPSGFRYEDARRARVVVVEDGRIVAAKLIGDAASERWLRDLALDGANVDGFGLALLRGGSQAPLATTPRGAIVCQCHGVNERSIAQALPEALKTSDPLRALGVSLRCGTECGSCRPELARIVSLARERSVA